MRGGAGRRGGGVLEHVEEEPAGAGDAGEGVEGGFEGGYGLDGDGHFGLGFFFAGEVEVEFREGLGRLFVCSSASGKGRKD